MKLLTTRHFTLGTGEKTEVAGNSAQPVFLLEMAGNRIGKGRDLQGMTGNGYGKGRDLQGMAGNGYGKVRDLQGMAGIGNVKKKNINGIF